MTAKTWNEVFARLDAFLDEFSADVRAVADVDGTDEAEVHSLRAALEAAEVEVKRLKRERDVLPTPDAANPMHLRWAADALVEKAARAIHDSDEQGKFPPKEWGARSEALRNDYRANARALLAAGLLADGGDKA